MTEYLSKMIKLLASCLILLALGMTFLLADASGTQPSPESQPDQVSVHLDGTILSIIVYDASVITKLRRVVGNTSELSDMVRIVTKQSDPEGWETVLSEGHLPGSWQDDNGYFEICYVALNKNGNVWEGTIKISRTPTLSMLYLCTQGWYEDAVILGIAIDKISPPTLQSGNLAETSLFNANPADELADNRIAQLGSLADSPPRSESAVERLVAGHVALGLKWYRIALDWLDWNEVVQTKKFSDHNVAPYSDYAITALNNNGISVMLDLVYWDDAISTYDPPERLYFTPAEIDKYADYVRTIVRHFRGRVTSYALLNEPNVPDPGQYVAVEDYIKLVRQVVPAIREEDPQANVVIGEITPLWDCGGLEYLFAILESGILSMADGIAWHWGGASPELQSVFYYAYPQLVKTIRQMAITNGFQGELLAEELIFRTNRNPHPFGHEFSDYREIPAAKYHARVAVMNLGMDVATGFALENTGELPHLQHIIENLCTVMAGHEAIDMPVAIDMDYDGPAAYCAFRYPNGDRMLAVWTDGIAQEFDPGVSATIAFPSLAARGVTGIDVLQGIEQELVFEMDGNSTIIHDLLIKDYPIFIRLRAATMDSEYEETVGNGFHQLGEIPSPAVWVVTSTADSGDGTLRWALQSAHPGETITFNPVSFPPDTPATIRVTSMLPILSQGNLRIDASNAGVIIDGIGIQEPNVWCLEIPSSGNAIQGLQIVNFTGTGIQLVGGAQHNLVGGDRSIGTGLLGQGNLCSANGRGIGIYDDGTSHNTITGNLIGTDASGTSSVGNNEGIRICSGASHNTIGPSNVIAYNRGWGIIIQGADSLANQITGNSIHENAEGDILREEGGN